MKNNFNLTDEMLWDYADGFLQTEEKLRVETYLRQNPEQQARFDAIMVEKRAFTGLTLDTPNSGFAQNVMAAWVAEQAPAKAKDKGRDWILWAIAGAFGLMMLVPFLFSNPVAPAEFSMQIPAEYIPHLETPAFDWAGFFSSALLRNAVLLTMAFMSLKILDKYLQIRNHRLAAH